MAFISAFRRVLGGSSSALHSQFAAIRHNSTLTSPRLFISGLSRLTTDEKLREAFSPFGQIVDAKVVIDRVSQRSKGFGFITYASVEEFLEGWVIFVDPAKPREPRFPPPPQAQQDPSETGFRSNKTIGWCG
ncbi:glycine-rich RNA-binding protein 6 [Pyrus ussuriensis x Pyrus communis]|uniref:Glycine-rich RNA-binding protein 6 n=1 Tax=Pyrus ussuriensis x Pyrus communis TaxID=2448454 RepID=A0A5N5HGA2_9ROSA|nr:glycine-rich RNA-binding protein 6 [Pyrus ussuriensis x Pyrus communis]